MSNTLFPEFTAATKAEWMARIEKDLKGKPLDDLRWKLGNLTVDPFLTPEDVKENRNSILTHRIQNQWEIGDTIVVANLSTANKEALTALQHGTEALDFELSTALSVSDLAILLANINTGFISLHFKGNVDIDFCKNLYTYLSSISFNPLEQKGSIEGLENSPAIAETIFWAKNHFPNFTFLNAMLTAPSTGESLVTDLAALAGKASDWMSALTENGFSVEAIQSTLQFKLTIGTSYFVEIARLRALRLLWANVLAAYGANPTLPLKITAITFVETKEDNANTNLIRATTQAASAIIGGADTLFVSPAGTGEKTAFYHHIARNAQHLMKMESYLDRVIDPAAGSYYIEQLTDQLAESAWKMMGGN